MKKFLILGVWSLVFATSASAICTSESSPLGREDRHFVDSVVWRLRVTEAPPEIDSSANGEQRSAALLKKMNELMKYGAEFKKPGQFLSQDDYGTLGQFLHKYHFTMNEILQARSRIGLDERFTQVQINEAQHLLSDFATVRGRMDEYEEYEGMRCHFFWGQRMWKSIRNPDSARVRREFGIKALTDERVVIGGCWSRDLP